jgi:branched-chain amino acid transport system permease protein
VAKGGATWAAAVAALVLATYATSAGTAAILQTACIIAALGVAFQVVYGLLGELSLGHSALFGIGAYAYSAASTRGMNLGLAVGLACVLGIVAGTLVAAVTVRAIGAYFAIVTFALASIAAAAVSATTYLGRDEGIIGVPAFPPLPFGTFAQSQLLYAGATMLAYLVLLWVLSRSMTGFTLETVRTNAALASSIGINVRMLRVVATGLSGLMAALVGALYAQSARFVSPDVFGFYYIVTPLAVIAIGGARSILAAIAGSAVVVVIPRTLHVDPIVNQIIGGALLSVVILVFPLGVMGGLKSFLPFLRRLSPAARQPRPQADG